VERLRRIEIAWKRANSKRFNQIIEGTLLYGIFLFEQKSFRLVCRSLSLPESIAHSSIYSDVFSCKAMHAI